jgi:hypothetical protein
MKLRAAYETRESLISIVDDEVCVRESLSSVMKSAGHKGKENDENCPKAMKTGGGNIHSAARDETRHLRQSIATIGN